MQEVKVSVLFIVGLPVIERQSCLRRASVNNNNNKHGSLDECRLSAGWPPTVRPNQPIWAVSPPKDWLLPFADTIAIYLLLLSS